ncbi:MAG: oligopeptide:H+ symporter [Gammaproteobacteria bacterium]
MATVTVNPINLKRGPYVVISTVIWEFFSYYGMCSLLILYLTQFFHFSDQYSYSLFGTYTSLVYLTPIIGGWLADHYLGNRISMILGAILIMCGHFTLACTTLSGLYLGLSFLICGMGFFKSSAICLITEYYKNPTERKSAFIIYYLGGNVGAAVAPLVCGYAAAKYGWDYGFAAAGAGMLCGLLILFKFRKYLAGIGNPHLPFFNEKNKFNIKLILSYLALVFGMLGTTAFIVIKLWGGYVLIATTLVSFFIIGKIYFESKNTNNQAQQNGLTLAFILTVFGVLFWVFGQQGVSSISLFIERFVDRNLYCHFGNLTFQYLIPTPMFQTINPSGIVIFGLLVAYCLKKLAKINITINSITQVILGTALLTVGFWLFSAGASSAQVLKISMIWAIIGLTVISAAEIFIDPVIVSAISEVAPVKALGTLTAIYYLFTGSISNYLAAWVAKFTASPSKHASAILYQNTYLKIFYIGLLMIIVLCCLRWKTSQEKS